MFTKQQWFPDYGTQTTHGTTEITHFTTFYCGKLSNFLFSACLCKHLVEITQIK